MTAEQDYHDALTAADSEFHATIKPAADALAVARRALPAQLDRQALPPAEGEALRAAVRDYHDVLAAARERHDLLVLAAIAARDEVEGSDVWRQPAFDEQETS